MERPDGFSVMWPSVGSDEFSKRFFSQWHDRWVILSDWPVAWTIFGDSSYKIYLAAQIFLQNVIFPENAYYSIIVGSVISRAIFYASIVGLLFVVRESLPVGAYCIFGGGLLIFALDSSWIAFFNSFFEEQIAVIFIPVLALLLVLYYQDGGRKRFGVLFLLCATFVGAAKTAYFYLPILGALFVLPIFRGHFSWLKFFMVILCCQLISTSPVYYGKASGINAYHALYYGALKVVPAGEINKLEAGTNYLPECIGVSAFDQSGAQCMDKADVNYYDLTETVARYPTVLVRMISMAVSEGKNVSLDYLGKGISGGPIFSDARVFNLGSLLFKYGFNIFCFGLFFLALLLLVLRRSVVGDQLLGVGLFFSVFGFSQYFIALGDGFYELGKHLIIGNYALAFSAIFIVPWMLIFLFSSNWRRSGV